MNVLIEGFGPDAIELAPRLAASGARVRLAGPEPAPPQADDLRELGIAVDPHVDLDTAAASADIAYLDPWTPDTAPRVGRLKAQGTRISCLGELLLEQWDGPTIGITGTAGKTSTTAATAGMLRASGIEIAVSRGARAGNLWPTGDLLDFLDHGARATTLLLELTSSHLAFMQTSPTIAAVTSFWPDHLELHGSFARYRAAKETIVRGQQPTDIVVVNADDDAAGFASCTPAIRSAFSLRQPVANGAYVDAEGHIVLVRDGDRTRLGPLPKGRAHGSNLIAAAAIALAAGASPDAIEHGIVTTQMPAWRASPAGMLAGIPVVDDGMAATPSKTAALLRSYPNRDVVLIAGGMNHAGGGLVHAAPEETILLERACDEVARIARLVILFGEAAARLSPLLERRGVRTIEADDLEDAVGKAATAVAPATMTSAVIFSPLFPVSIEDRGRFQSLVERHC